MLLVVDQFEEIFTLCQNETERQHFIENLLYAAAREGRVIVLLTMRADFYHRCAAYRKLAACISTQQLFVSPMNETEMQRTIERPAQTVGLRFEPGLVETILADVVQQPEALPFLQYALLELWQRRQHGQLTLQAYQASGGVAGAMAQRAETLYADFNPDERIMVRRVMLRLTQLGEGTEDTRRRARMSEFVSEQSDQKLPDKNDGVTTPLETVIQQLADARLVVTTRDMTSGEETVDVAHEALIRGWARLREWLDEDRAALRTHRRLTQAAEEWERNKQDKSYLYHGARLAELRAWAEQYDTEMNALERKFLAKSVAEQEREIGEKEAQQLRELIAAKTLSEERRQATIRLRRRAKWLIGTGIAALALAIFAFILVGIANEARQTAETQNAIAEARYLAAQSLINLDRRPQRSLLLAIEAITTAQGSDNDVPEAEQALRHLLAATGGKPLQEHRGTVRAVSFSSDGTWLATAGEDGSLRLWDAADPDKSSALRFQHDAGLLSLSFSPQL